MLAASLKCTQPPSLNRQTDIEKHPDRMGFMSDKTFRNQLIFAICFCVAYVLTSYFWHHSDLFAPDIREYVISIGLFAVPIGFIIIVALAIRGLLDIFRNRQNISLRFCLPTIVYMLTLFNSVFDPYHHIDDIFGGKVVLRACYEGTMNTSSVKFRENKTFTLNATGVFGCDEWFTGHWSQTGDSIYLTYDNKKFEQFGDKVVIYKGYLIPASLCNDSLNENIIIRQFYLGQCKGLN